MADYEPHPIAEMFPMMDDAALAELAQDIRDNGMQEKIKLWEGMILDGRNVTAPVSSPRSNRSSRP